MKRSVSERGMYEDEGEMRTVLPQVTEPWRFSMGVVGAASTEAARAMVAMNEVYMLADMRARVGLEVLETKDCLLAGY